MIGTITKVSGPVIEAVGLKGVKMFEVTKVGEEHLIGEVIQLRGEKAIVQVYEETSGIAPGDKVIATGAPLSAELGPGLISGIFDGILRPLEVIKSIHGNFIKRGVECSALNREIKWHFTPTVKLNTKVSEGQSIGFVKETDILKHYILVPPKINGNIIEIMDEGRYTVEDVVAIVNTSKGKKELKLYQTWPVRQGRPYRRKLDLSTPLITGQRILDTFFPMAKGGTGAIPGGFGTGKTVTQQQLAKWCDADIIIYVGCGERGNEMTDVLDTFPKLTDPKTGKPLIERIIIIANTSNMPVAAREASIYTGMTLGEYFRDQGYSVALMADSTSRWAEAMREISGRLEEMPGEEGYPAYLPSRLAEFYERAGLVESLGGQKGSISVIGAVSPPGGDFSEPVTQSTLRVTKVFWALDKGLASRRHFPAISWLDSYSLYTEGLSKWYINNISNLWRKYTSKAMYILQKEQELIEIVRLVGPDALPESDRLILEISKMIREDFLQQSAYHEEDSFCPLEKQFLMLEIILIFYRETKKLLSKGVSISKISELGVKNDIARMKEVAHTKFTEYAKQLKKRIKEECEKLISAV